MSSTSTVSLLSLLHASERDVLGQVLRLARKHADEPASQKFARETLASSRGGD